MPTLTSLFKRLAPLLGLVIGVLGVIFVALNLISKWDEVSTSFSKVTPHLIAGSIIIGLASKLVISSLWIEMMEHRGNSVERRQATSWFFTGQLGKYVPGGIWPIVGRAELATRGGIPRIDAYGSTGLSMVTLYLAAIVTICISSLLTGDRFLLSILAIGAMVIGFACFSGKKLRTTFLRMIGRFLPNIQELTEPKRLLQLSIAHIPSWILMSLSTSMTAVAFDLHIGINDMLFITTASWFVGFIVIGVPGGIGVREAVFISMAVPVMSDSAAVSLALMSRVVFILVDVLGALIATVVARSGNPRVDDIGNHNEIAL